MEQLRCDLSFEPTPDLQRVGRGDLWSFDLGLDEWTRRDEAMDGFRAPPLDRRLPERARIEQTWV
jgi:hypothetical protein